MIVHRSSQIVQRSFTDFSKKKITSVYNKNVSWKTVVRNVNENTMNATLITALAFKREPMGSKLYLFKVPNFNNLPCC